MRNVLLILLAVLTATVSAHTQTQAQKPTLPLPPQTARQALIEMFMGKSPDSFTRHLPTVASQTLIRKGEGPETSMVQKISMIGHQFAAQGHVETFDEGPTLLVSEQEEGKAKVKTEVTVERDNLMGESDEIEVSIHVYRDGQPEFLPVIPRLIFSMTQEKDIWRLIEATLAVHVPLTDPDYLKGVRTKEDESNENMASARLRMIMAAEKGYSGKHPDQGYTCKLADLFRQQASAVPSGEQAEEYNSGLLGQEFAGYHFALAGCEGSPASKFQVTAVPVASEAGMKTFCADESGSLRFTVNGKGAACLSRGQVLNQGATYFPGED
jgi:hypothetical protein